MNNFIVHSDYIYHEVLYVEAKDVSEAKAKYEQFEIYDWDVPGTLSIAFPNREVPYSRHYIVENFEGTSWPGDEQRRFDEKCKRDLQKLEEELARAEELDDLKEPWFEKLRYRLRRIRWAIYDWKRRPPRFKTNWYSPRDGAPLNRYAVHCRDFVSETLYIEAGNAAEAREKAAEPLKRKTYDVPGVVSDKHIWKSLTPRLAVEEYVGEEWPPLDPSEKRARLEAPEPSGNDDVPF